MQGEECQDVATPRPAGSTASLEREETLQTHTQRGPGVATSFAHSSEGQKFLLGRFSHRRAKMRDECGYNWASREPGDRQQRTKNELRTLHQGEKLKWAEKPNGANQLSGNTP